MAASCGCSCLAAPGPDLPSLDVAPSLQVYYSLLVFGTIFVSIVVLSAVQYQSCWSYLDSSLGAMPVQASSSSIYPPHHFPSNCVQPGTASLGSTEHSAAVSGAPMRCLLVLRAVWLGQYISAPPAWPFRGLG